MRNLNFNLPGNDGWALFLLYSTLLYSTYSKMVLYIYDRDLHTYLPTYYICIYPPLLAIAYSACMHIQYAHSSTLLYPTLQVTTNYVHTLLRLGHLRFRSSLFVSSSRADAGVCMRIYLVYVEVVYTIVYLNYTYVITVETGV